jgi:putative transposase
MVCWAAERSVSLRFIDPGKPTQNARIEPLNGKIRDVAQRAWLQDHF